MRPVCRDVDVQDGTRLRIDQGRRFQRPYVAIRASAVVAGCRLAVEKCGIHRAVVTGIAPGRCSVEQLAPDAGGHPLERPAQRRGCRESPAGQLQEGADTIHLARPVDEFAVGRVHVNA